MKYIIPYKLFEYNLPLEFEDTFFKPDDDFVNWIIKYANNRPIIDIGAGRLMHLSKLIYNKGYHKIIAIEPRLDTNDIKNAKNQTGTGFRAFCFPSEHIDSSELYSNEYNPLMIFARPCHGTKFVEKTLKLKGSNVEALYITVPENIEAYDDLGSYKEKAKQIQHEGKSEDNEIVLSIK